MKEPAGQVQWSQLTISSDEAEQNPPREHGQLYRVTCQVTSWKLYFYVYRLNKPTGLNISEAETPDTLISPPLGNLYQYVICFALEPPMSDIFFVITVICDA